MRPIYLIVAMDEQRGIGKHGQLLCHLPNDLKRFKEKTMHGTVMMGRKTFESIGKPLPNRRNIVISKTISSHATYEVYDSIDTAMAHIDSNEPIWVIGGGEIYKALLPLATQIHLTRIHHSFDADTYFPLFDEAKYQEEIECEQTIDEKHSYSFTIKTYLIKH